MCVLTDACTVLLLASSAACGALGGEPRVGPGWLGCAAHAAEQHAFCCALPCSTTPPGLGLGLAVHVRHGHARRQCIMLRSQPPCLGARPAAEALHSGPAPRQLRGTEHSCKRMQRCCLFCHGCPGDLQPLRSTGMARAMRHALPRSSHNPPDPFRLPFPNDRRRLRPYCCLRNPAGACPPVAALQLALLRPTDCCRAWAWLVPAAASQRRRIQHSILRLKNMRKQEDRRPSTDHREE